MYNMNGGLDMDTRPGGCVSASNKKKLKRNAQKSKFAQIDFWFIGDSTLERVPCLRI